MQTPRLFSQFPPQSRLIVLLGAVSAIPACDQHPDKADATKQTTPAHQTKKEQKPSFNRTTTTQAARRPSAENKTSETSTSYQFGRNTPTEDRKAFRNLLSDPTDPLDTKQTLEVLNADLSNSSRAQLWTEYQELSPLLDPLSHAAILTGLVGNPHLHLIEKLAIQLELAELLGIPPENTKSWQPKDWQDALENFLQNDPTLQQP